MKFIGNKNNTMGDISFKKKLSIGFILLPIIGSLSIPQFLKGVFLIDCSVIEGPIATFYTYAIEVVFVIWILFVCTRAFRKAQADFKKQIILMGFGSIVFLMAFSYGNIIGSITENWGLAQVGIFGMPVFLGFLSYLVVKYKAFNSRLLAAQALVWVLAFVVSALLFVRTINTIRIVVVGTLFLVVIIGYVLVRSVKREEKQRNRLEELSVSLEKSNLNLADANDKLKGLDKLKTEFLSLASHQLRTPLTAIKGYASMLSEGAFGSLEEKQNQAVKRIYTSAQGLVNVVEDLLNVSKIEQGGMKYEFSPTDLSAVVSQLYGEMKVPAESKDLEFTLEMDKHDKFIVNADPVKLKQVFLNLTDNSIKYTKKGFVKISLVRDGNNIIFSVSDNGMGISAETRAKLFEKFSRGEGGKTNTGGSGLGLFIPVCIWVAITFVLPELATGLTPTALLNPVTLLQLPAIDPFFQIMHKLLEPFSLAWHYYTISGELLGSSFTHNLPIVKVISKNSLQILTLVGSSIALLFLSIRSLRKFDPRADFINE
jgi:signal transduction histidine kinase